MHITVELLESDAKIQRLIYEAIAEEFNNRMLAKLSNIKLRIGNLTVQLLKTTATYQSLIGGELAGHFGLPISSRLNMVNNLLLTIQNSMEITYTRVRASGNRFFHGMNMGVLIKDFSDILSMSEAIVTTEKAQALPWLEWLLTAGNRMIISEHDIKFLSGKGRSGIAIMVNNNSGVWRVPPAYAGTLNNNWLTRAFVDNQAMYSTEINKILENELQ